MLTSYLTQVQNLLGTSSAGNLYSQAQLTAYINEGRQEVAKRGQCVRALSPIAGPIAAITVITGGSGYSVAPSITISQPDFPTGFLPYPNGLLATAVATIAGGALTAITLSSPGAGYFSPAITISSSLGTTAVASATVNNVLATNPGQEQYSFGTILPTIQSVYSGINEIVSIRSIAFIWGTFRYVRMSTSFTRYQAWVRTYSNQYEYIPSVVAQYGQGAAGTLFMYPIPNSNYQFEADCLCLPNDLVLDTDFEAIPDPWRVCVQYYAAYKAFLGVQRYADAKIMFNDQPKAPGLFQQFMQVARQSSMPGMIVNPYGRG